MNRLCCCIALLALPMILTCSDDSGPTGAGPTVVVEAPDPVALGQVTATDSTIVLAWHPSEDSLFGRYIISIAHDTALSSAAPVCTLRVITDTSAVIGGLLPATRYRIVVTVQNSAGLVSSTVLDTWTGDTQATVPAVVKVDSVSVGSTVYRGTTMAVQFAYAGDSLSVCVWPSGDMVSVDWRVSGGTLVSGADSLKRVYVAGSGPVDTVACTLIGYDSSSVLVRVLVVSQGVRAGALRVIAWADQGHLVASDTVSTLVNIRVLRQDSTPAPGVALAIVSSVVPDSGDMVVLSSVSAVTDSLGEDTVRVRGIAYDGTVRVTVTAADGVDAGSAFADIQCTVIRRMHISVAPAEVPADGESSARVRVLITNDRGNPIAGDTVLFSTTAGTITSPTVTNASGVADAVLVSDRRDILAQAFAWLQRDVSKCDSVAVLFSGVTVTPSWLQDTLRPDLTDTTVLTLTVKDAAGVPIAAEPVYWRCQKSDTTQILNQAYATDYAGRASCVIVGTGHGCDTLTVVCAGVTAHPVVCYCGLYLVIDTLPGQSYAAGTGDSVAMRVRCLTGQGVPVPSVGIRVVSSSGDIAGVCASGCQTDSSGQVLFHLRNPSVPGEVHVIAHAVTPEGDIEASMTVRFGALAPRSISVTASPSSISVNGDTAVVTARAWDSVSNPVEGVVVFFALVSSAGGGDRIEPVVGMTGSDGVARCRYISGSLASVLNGVAVVAETVDGVLSDTARITVGGVPYSITLCATQTQATDNGDGTVSLPVSAIVTDVNGNAVADGQMVTFGCRITGYVTWKYGALFQTTVDEWGHGWLSVTIMTDTLVIPFEDLNDNLQLDPGEDRNGDGVASRGEDYNGDGMYVTGPGFEDINHNGVRDKCDEFGNGCAEPMIAVPMWRRRLVRDSTWNAADSVWEVDTTYEWYVVLDTAIADYNHNGIRDTIEPLLTSTMTWEEYVAARDAYDPVVGFDRDFDGNGVPDPTTTVTVPQSVAITNGTAGARLTYASSDAGRIQVTVTAECGGVVPVVPLVIVLPGAP